jgi:hypothetical protein
LEWWQALWGGGAIANEDRLFEAALPANHTMFIVRFSPGICFGFSLAFAYAATLDGAVGFASEFAPNKMGVVASSWFERDGTYVIEVVGWCEAWFHSPPVIAEITAPPGRRLKTEQLN